MPNDDNPYRQVPVGTMVKFDLTREYPEVPSLIMHGVPGDPEKAICVAADNEDASWHTNFIVFSHETRNDRSWTARGSWYLAPNERIEVTPNAH